MSRVVKYKKLSNIISDNDYLTQDKIQTMLLCNIAESLAVIADKLTESEFSNGNDPQDCGTCEYGMQPSDMSPCNICIRHSMWEEKDE